MSGADGLPAGGVRGAGYLGLLTDGNVNGHAKAASGQTLCTKMNGATRSLLRTLHPRYLLGEVRANPDDLTI